MTNSDKPYNVAAARVLLSQVKPGQWPHSRPFGEYARSTKTGWPAALDRIEELEAELSATRNGYPRSLWRNLEVSELKKRIAELEAEIHRLKPPMLHSVNHWYECYRARGHHACAVEFIDRLRSAMKPNRKEPYSNELRQAIEDLEKKYEHEGCDLCSVEHLASYERINTKLGERVTELEAELKLLQEPKCARE